MSEHSSVEKNIDLLRLFFKDLIEDQAIYEKSDSRVLEFSLAFDHSRFGSVSILLQVDLELDGSLIRFTGLDIEYADTSKESVFMETAQALRLGAHSYLELARTVVVGPSESLLESPQVTLPTYRTMLQKEQVFTVLNEILCYDVKLFATRYPTEVLWNEDFDERFQSEYC